MQTSDEKTFVDNPFDALKTVIPLTVAMFVVVFILVSLFGMPKSRYGTVMSKEKLYLTVLGFDAALIALIALVASFSKKRTIVCNGVGCEITRVNFWGKEGKTDRFGWREVTALTVKLRPRAQIDLNVTVKDQEIFLVRRIWSGREFDELLGLFERAAPHLPYEWIKKDRVGLRPVIEEANKYCKVAR